MNSAQTRILTGLGIGILIGLAFVSWHGVFIESTYIRDSASMRAQGIGQDLVDLVLVCPLLVLSLFLIQYRIKLAYFLYGGTVLYLFYSFIIYSFGVHFNQLFLLYCWVLGTSAYSFVCLLSFLLKQPVENWFREQAPTKLVSGFLFLIAVLFYMMWLKELLPALLEKKVPLSLIEADLMVNPIHVIDLSVALPGLIISGILLLKKKRLGFLMAPVWLVFCLVLALALIGMVINMKREGITDDSSIMGVFGVLAGISFLLFVWLIRGMKKLQK